MMIKLSSLIFLVMVLACSSNSSRAARLALDGCPDRCGDLIIPYPFGVGKGCYLEKKFQVTCDENTSSGAPIAYLWTGDINVTNISLHEGELQVWQYIAGDCYNRRGLRRDYSRPWLWLTYFTISATKNKFYAIGCDTFAIIQGYNRKDERFITGCTSLCYSMSSVHTESCSGVGCCETSIPVGFKNRSVTLSSYYNHTYVWGFNPCSYAFVVEETKFKFSNTSFQDLAKIEMLPMIVDWSVGSVSCEDAQSLRNLACMGNSRCVNSITGLGYLCQCLPGFEGNPYHPDGCRDIDECKVSNRCTNGTCHNAPGSFYCSCQEGYTLTNETICSAVNTSDRSSGASFIYVPLGVSFGFIALLVAGLLIYWTMKKRKLMKLKEKFFEQNGGLMLQRRMSSHRGSPETTTIFSAEELKKATNNYDESRILGQGGYGTVYKGILPDSKVVAIKKSKLGTQMQSEQFINEVIVLMQINHRNVVRLLGCCLETEVPLLVYEFITNGTLFKHIHNKGQVAPLSWELRLKIAAETAGALAYLHSEASTPIIHRDVKTNNILLDDSYTAKVSDFGTSRLIPLDQDQLTTLVQGTFGYLDPEYFHSSQLTEKSDVYSFGVVLAELLTGEKALSFDRPEKDRNLATFFVSAIEDDRLLQIIDEEIVNEERMEEIREVANLTKRCLEVKGEERPTMKEVATELEGLRIMGNHPWVKADLCSEETEHFLSKPSYPFPTDVGDSSVPIFGTDGIQNQGLRPYHDGR